MLGWENNQIKYTILCKEIRPGMKINEVIQIITKETDETPDSDYYQGQYNLVKLVFKRQKNIIMFSGIYMSLTYDNNELDSVRRIDGSDFPRYCEDEVIK
jgi:hypothetical protein